MDERISGMNRVTLLRKKFHYPPGQLAGNTDCRTFHLAFDHVVGFVHEYKTDGGYYGNDRHHDCHRKQQCLFGFLCLCCIVGCHTVEIFDVFI